MNFYIKTDDCASNDKSSIQKKMKSSLELNLKVMKFYTSF